MIERPEDWDEAFLRYLGGEADEDLERQVRERLMADEAARERFVTLACQQQALADVLGEAAGRAPSTRTRIARPPAPRKPGYGWMLAAAAILVAVLGLWLSRSESEPRRKETPLLRPEARSPETPRTPEAPRVAAPEKKTPAPPTPPVPERLQQGATEPTPPTPKPDVREPDPPKPEEPKSTPPTPKPEPPTRVVTETVVATIDRVEGQVALFSGDVRAVAVAKQSILAGQGLETVGPGSSIAISFADGTQLRLEPGTLVKDLADDRKGKRLYLAKGGLWAEVRKQPADQQMTLTTPNGEAKVVGTKFRLFFDEKSVSTRLEVEEGKVRLKRLADAKMIDVNPGHFAVAATGVDMKPLPSILSGLVGYWRFEDPTGMTMTDSSGQGNHGTLVGKARRTLGKFGQGLDLDGATALVQVPHAPDLNPGPSSFSLSIWVRNRKENEWFWNLFFKDDGKFQSYYYFAVGTKPRFEFSTGDAKVTVDGKTGVNDNRWHHLVAVRNSPYSGQLYVDGVLDSSASVAPSQQSTIRTTTPLIIGAGNGNFYTGQIDDARIYNRALSADDVRQLFAGR